MGAAALAKVRALGGWSEYGDRVVTAYAALAGAPDADAAERRR
jgi:hypothetical protein